MKKILVVMFLVFALVSWGCDDGKKTLSGDEEGVILIEERTLSEEEIEEECPNGGVKIVTGFDKNGNGELDEEEILDTHFVCHGEDGNDGRPGTDGKDGADGTSTLTQVVPIEEEDEGHDCEKGGYWVITCEDDGDGECVDDTETYEAVCHGVDGEEGAEGEKGDEGEQGADGACYGNIAPVIGKIEINGTEFVGTPVVSGGVTNVDITATDADGDELIYVVTGSGAIIEQDETDKNIFTLTFNSEGIYYFSVIVSDGCQMAVKSFAVEFVCAGDFPNYHDGKCWSDASENTMDWDNAISYCEDLGGRLPNINELRTLIQNCPQTEYPQPEGQDPWCEIEDPDKLDQDSWDNAACIPSCPDVSSVFGDTGWFWSLSERTDYGYIGHFWGVSFHTGYSAGRLGTLLGTDSSLFSTRCIKVY